MFKSQLIWQPQWESLWEARTLLKVKNSTFNRWSASVCCNTAQALAFLLVSVCCDTAHVLVFLLVSMWHSLSLGVLASVSVLWHSPNLGVPAGVCVLWHCPSLGVLASVSVLWHSPSLGVLAGVSVLWHCPSHSRALMKTFTLLGWYTWTSSTSGRSLTIKTMKEMDGGTGCTSYTRMPVTQATTGNQNVTNILISHAKNGHYVCLTS